MRTRNWEIYMSFESSEKPCLSRFDALDQIQLCHRSLSATWILASKLGVENCRVIAKYWNDFEPWILPRFREVVRWSCGYPKYWDEFEITTSISLRDPGNVMVYGMGSLDRRKITCQRIYPMFYSSSFAKSKFSKMVVWCFWIPHFLLSMKHSHG